MANVRAFVFVLLLFVILENVAAKPFFGSLLCGFVCDYFDDSDSSEDYDCDCNPRLRRTTTTSTITPVSGFAGNNVPVNLMIPPGEGLNATITQNRGSWVFNFIPWAGQGGGAAFTATTVAAATTAAPGAAAMTAAPGAATTAAAATTTATTAAAGK